ncbi:D-alanine--D-alanine ligase [Catenulispora sp. NF23]|uniref:D-alanine--D-alanine ligase n=1 Tax=Catenulispora pinistramenti TaxID=2705254 RepID=A0ABS5KXA5_9ACTN|nr:D-alanine--D-alanine ligase [Catenulispora pinistramenti]MBS2534051.1 D-alanine--D-alanine ligase [Catenulispora pinistramenti]MBS2550683.1 D-alanine--D-alanine ligase [Catenulispora pinistramenti]
MSDLGRVVVLAGGLSHERDVSIRSGRRVADALRGAGVEVQVRDVDAGLLPSLLADRPDAVFPTLHGATGEDGAIQGILALLGVPYVGSSAAACRRTFDKPSAKDAIRAAGLSTPDWVAIPKTTFRDLGTQAVLDAVSAAFPLPLFVKPARGGSSLGAAAVRTREELPAALVACFAYDETALIERQITGREIAVAVVDTGDGPRALPAVEIVADSGVYDYAARYTAGITEFFAPARLTPDEEKAVADVAVRAHTTLGLSCMSRTDLILDADSTPWFLEVAVAPGLTETSSVPLAVGAANLDLGVLYRNLVEAVIAK